MQRWQRQSRMLPAHLAFHLLVHTQTSEVSHEILSLWKAWVTYLASHGVVMMCPTHHDDDKMTDKTCYACFPQGQDLTELVSQDPCPLRISHVSECMVSSNCKHAHFSLTVPLWIDESRISCCQCKRMLCESVKVTVPFSYATYPHCCHQTCHQTTRVANRRRCPSKCWCGFCARLVMRGRGRVFSLLVVIWILLVCGNDRVACTWTLVRRVLLVHSNPRIACTWRHIRHT
jgi:hypothetical protein